MSHTNLERLSKIGLVVGYLGLLGAVVVAHRTPATGYELSLYRSTPTAVWIGLAVAVVAGCLVVVPAVGRLRDAGLALIGASGLTLFSLPILRGYYFYGAGDALTHLGWAREMVAGTFQPVELLYPGIHLLTVAVGTVGGVPLSTALLYVVLVLLPFVFLVFVPLCVRLLTGSRHALVVGTLAAVLFVPINNISVHPTAHPASQAILFLPFVFYLVLRYVLTTDGPSDGVSLRGDPLADGGTDDRRRLTGIGVLVAIVSAAVVLLHPQQALNVVVLFGAVAGTQLLYRQFVSDHPIVGHRTLYAQTGIITGLFVLWASQFPVVRIAITSTLDGLFASETAAGDVVAAKSQSLSALGGDIVFLFVRLFLPALLLSLLAGALLVGVVRSDLFSSDANANGLLVYFAVALVPLFGVFSLLLVGGYGDMYFRYQGFIMVPVTILAAVALTKWLGSGSTPGTSHRTVARLAVVLLVVMLPIAALGLHPSPYMYQPTPHVTETAAEGYASSFEHRVPDREFVGISGGPSRYVDAAYGTNRAETTLGFPGYSDRLPEPVFDQGNYSDYFAEDRYMAVTPADRRVETELYDGFRYSERGFDRLDSTPRVSRVRASEGFQLYYLAEEA